MSNTRVLLFSKGRIRAKCVIFTEDFSISAENYRPINYELDSDTVINCEMPPGFPLDQILRRS
jgi:hypothetical protein